jgi:hypothetical protein
MKSNWHTLSDVGGSGSLTVLSALQEPDGSRQMNCRIHVHLGIKYWAEECKDVVVERWRPVAHSPYGPQRTPFGLWTYEGSAPNNALPMYHRSYSVRLVPASIVLQTNADIVTFPVPQSKQKVTQSTRWYVGLRISEGLFGLTDDGE